MQIEIYSDIVCPWCYLGKRRLEAALERSPLPQDVVLRWRPFQLDPDAPRTPVARMDWLTRQRGSAEYARAEAEKITRIANADGLRFDLDRAVMANSFDAHRLLWFADQPESVFAGAGPDTQAELAEALHRSHFTDGRDISDIDVLLDLADEVGLDTARVARLLRSREATADVRGQLARAYDLGITSVPTFVFAGTYTVSGAQEVSAMTALLAEVARRERLAPSVGYIPRQRTAPAADGDTRVA